MTNQPGIRYQPVWYQIPVSFLSITNHPGINYQPTWCPLPASLVSVISQPGIHDHPAWYPWPASQESLPGILDSVASLVSIARQPCYHYQSTWFPLPAIIIISSYCFCVMTLFDLKWIYEHSRWFYPSPWKHSWFIGRTMQPMYSAWRFLMATPVRRKHAWIVPTPSTSIA